MSEESDLFDQWANNHDKAFEDGVVHGFKCWELLNVAIKNQWGGVNSTEKIDAFIDELIEYFQEKDDIYPQLLEEYLFNFISIEFKIDAQDGSTQWLSRLLCTLYNDIYNKQDFDGLYQFLQQQPSINMEGEDDSSMDGDYYEEDGTYVEYNPDDDDYYYEEEEEEEEEEKEEEGNDQDDNDGWTTVTR